MLMVHHELRVAVATNHLPLEQVKPQLSKESIAGKIRSLINSLKEDFHIKKPKLAVMGLNPHAGDQGLIGSEEREIIWPAIKEFQEDYALVKGPFPADGFFWFGSVQGL